MSENMYPKKVLTMEEIIGLSMDQLGPGGVFMCAGDERAVLVLKEPNKKNGKDLSKNKIYGGIYFHRMFGISQGIPYLAMIFSMPYVGRYYLSIPDLCEGNDVLSRGYIEAISCGWKLFTMVVKKDGEPVAAYEGKHAEPGLQKKCKKLLMVNFVCSKQLFSNMSAEVLRSGYHEKFISRMEEHYLQMRPGQICEIEKYISIASALMER